MDTATGLALAANVVAITAIVAGWRQNSDSLETQRVLADLSHVRSLLDDAAIALHRSAYTLDEMRSQVAQHSPHVFKSDKGAEVFAALADCGRELDALLERLRVRLGDSHDVVRGFGAADAAVLDIYRAVGLVRLEPDAAGSPEAEGQIRDFHAATRTRLDDQRRRFDEARDRFVAAAYAEAGARLSGT